MIIQSPSRSALDTHQADDVRRSVGVEPPYVALSDLSGVEPGVLQAVIPRVESPVGGELPPISAAEAGRHMAILGECAAAHAAATGERSYYLVTAAHLTQPMRSPPADCGPLLATATATRTGASALARMTLRGNRGELCRLSAHYLVLAERQLPGWALDRPHDEGWARTSPFSRVPRIAVRCLGSCGAAGTLTVTEEQCRGHLVGHPRLPLAILMSGVTSLCTDVLRYRYADPALRYVVVDANVRAAALARPGDAVRLAVTVHDSDPPHELMVADARGADGFIASARVRIHVLRAEDCGSSSVGSRDDRRAMAAYGAL